MAGGPRGFPPKPTAIRIAEGMRGHRPLPTAEPQYQSGVPERPAGLSPASRKVWDQMVTEMGPTGVLRKVDGLSLAELCDDIALLQELKAGLRKLQGEIAKQAKATGKKLPGNTITVLVRGSEGRRILRSIRETSAAILAMRREFGLTPASNSRVEAKPSDGLVMDEMEKALCG